MLTERQKKFKKTLELELIQSDELIKEVQKRGYSDAFVKMLLAGKVIRKENLSEINRHE